jgi:hypothetical protein
LQLNGGKDCTSGAREFEVIEKASDMKGIDNVTVKEFPDMNHLFQTCKTGAMNEYATIERNN